MKNLSNQVRQTYTAVVKDEAIAAMQQSDLTSPFIFERAQEIAEAGLDSEREQSFQTIAKDLAKKDADIKHLKRENERLARQLEAAQREADNDCSGVARHQVPIPPRGSVRLRHLWARRPRCF